MWSDEGYKMSTNVSCFSGVSVMMNVTQEDRNTGKTTLLFTQAFHKFVYAR